MSQSRLVDWVLCIMIAGLFATAELPANALGVLKRRWLLYAELVFLLWLAYWLLLPPTPGKAVVVLGLAAGIMSVQPEMSHLHRFLWIALLFLFAVVEIKSIDIDRYLRDREQAVQLSEERKHFGQIANEITVAVERSEQHFSATMNSMTGLWSEATGGDSYIDFWITPPTGPFEVSVPGVVRGYVVANAYPHFVGRYPLHDVYVAPFCPMGWLPSINYGTMFPNEMGRPREGIYLQFPPNHSEQTCSLFINTSNGSYYQVIHFVKRGQKWAWASRFGKYGHKMMTQYSSPDFPKQKLRSNWQ